MGFQPRPCRSMLFCQNLVRNTGMFEVSYILAAAVYREDSREEHCQYLLNPRAELADLFGRVLTCEPSRSFCAWACRGADTHVTQQVYSCKWCCPSEQHTLQLHATPSTKLRQSNPNSMTLQCYGGFARASPQRCHASCGAESYVVCSADMPLSAPKAWTF